MRFQRKTRVLMVCTENICRSPMAEGLLRDYLQRSDLEHSVDVASAGTLVSWPGIRADQRAQRIAATRGIDLSGNRARRVTTRDLERSDIIFAMDETHLRDLQKLCEPRYHDRISLLLSHHIGQPLLAVPDPYFGNAEAFERVFRIIEDAMGDLMNFINHHIS